MSQSTQYYDAVIIGSGQGGSPLAAALAKAGWSTALVERKHVGGTCVNEGCTPSKTMIASARVTYLSQRAADYGVHTGDVRVVMDEVRQRKRSVVHNFRESQRERYEDIENLDLLMGEAQFVDKKLLDVHMNNGNQRRISADKIIIDTGGHAFIPPIAGLDTVPILTEVSVMDIDIVPDHLIILGGGAIGMEQGQMFRRFGSHVTIIERGDRLLSFVDARISEEVRGILCDDGIDILLNTDVNRVEEENDAITVSVQSADGKHILRGSHLLIATGRTPNTEILNLNAAEVETDADGYIKVNDRLETSAPDIYAIGDVNGGPGFTHISYDDFRVLRANLLDDANKTIKNRLVPYTIFIDPELGHVGLTEFDAKKQGYSVKTAEMPMRDVARAVEMGETRGMMKAVIDADTDQILGCTVLGVHGGEIMSVIEVAMMGQLPYTAMRDGIFAHPTLSESLNTLFASVEE